MIEAVRGYLLRITAGAFAGAILLAALPELVQPGDCVLVKASHSMAFERIVQALTQN